MVMVLRMSDLRLMGSLLFVRSLGGSAVTARHAAQ